MSKRNPILFLVEMFLGNLSSPEKKSTPHPYNGLRTMLRVLCGIAMLSLSPNAVSEPWSCHTIDNSAQGADGARLADYNGDGLLDIVTPFEEGGVVRLYLHPGTERVKDPWPSIHVANIASGEDAVMADLDGDGNVDVITSAEGKVRTMFVHWNRGDDTFETVALPKSKNAAQWMFAMPVDVNDDGRVDIVAGAKNEGAEIGWFESPEDPRDMDQWNWHAWAPAGWIMSIELHDVDQDGQEDVVYTDRRGNHRGIHCIDLKSGTVTTVSSVDAEYMFLGIGDVDGDGQDDIGAATSKGPVYIYHGNNWEVLAELKLGESEGFGKSVRFADIDDDGVAEVIVSCEHASGKHGVFYIELDSESHHTISGLEGTKFDLLQLHDVDGDGDLDVITCEERENLGLIWYENPLK